MESEYLHTNKKRKGKILSTKEKNTMILVQNLKLNIKRKGKNILKVARNQMIDAKRLKMIKRKKIVRVVVIKKVKAENN